MVRGEASRAGRVEPCPAHAFQSCLMVKVLFGLPLGKTTGIFEMAGADWPVPSFSTPSRGQSETGPWRQRHRESPTNEWLAGKHGTRRRQHRKVPGMDTATGGIRAAAFTTSREGDSPGLPELLDQTSRDEKIGTVTGKLPAGAPSPIGLGPMAPRWATPRTAGSAFDTRRCHAAILARGGTWRSGIRSDR